MTISLAMKSFAIAWIATALITQSACAAESHDSTANTGSSASTSSTVTAAQANSQCRKGDYPLTTLVSHASGEPVLSIPQPPGWQSSTEHNSALVRGVLLNPNLQANDFIPNAVVTLADVSGDADDELGAIYNEKAGIKQKVAITNAVTGYVCGYPSETVDYVIDGRPTTSLIVGAKDPHGKVWVSTVVISSAEPANPEFVKAKQAILSGFQLTVPSAG
jgi:hypothetical protein